MNRMPGIPQLLATPQPISPPRGLPQEDVRRVSDWANAYRPRTKLVQDWPKTSQQWNLVRSEYDAPMANMLLARQLNPD